MKNLVKLAAICIVVTVPRPIHGQSVDLPFPIHCTYMEVSHGEPYVRVTVNHPGHHPAELALALVG